MQDVKAHTLHNIEFYEGSIGNTRCITAMSGVGKVNAARCTQLMVDRFRPDRVVNIGSAGALHPDLNVGDVIISTACVQHDVDLTAFGLEKGAFDESESRFIQADAAFMKQCQKAMAQVIDGAYQILTGPIATGDQFNDSLEHKVQLYEEFGAYCNEMEGAAVAQVCAMCEIPFVIIRSISDKPDDQSSVAMYENFKQLAAERCAEFLVRLVAVLENQDKG
jgi:adenosylhomocysteine nucleosidase